MGLKSFIQSFVGQKVLGMLDYYRFPKTWNSWGGAFNDQEFRKKIFRELMERTAFSAIVETGTFRGATTKFLYEDSGLPVYTVEVNPRYYGYVKSKFLFSGGIRSYHADSRTFLNNLLSTQKFAGQSIFFYLDAHWGSDLPLAEELQIIFGKCKAVVMVDDFKVPGDDGYGYDTYPGNKILDLEYLRPVNRELDLSVFFPASRADKETGKKRGCIVLAREKAIITSLKGMITLSVHTDDNL